MQSFSDELIAARKSQGMTQEDLAKAVNVSRSMVSHWETGRNKPDVENTRRLSEVLHCAFAQEDIPVMMDQQPLERGGAAPSARRRWGYVCAFAGGMLAALFVWLILQIPARLDAPLSPDKVPARAVDSEFPYETHSIAWYKLPNQPVPDRPYLEFLVEGQPVKATRTDDLPGGIGWTYTLDLVETHGFDYEVEECLVAVFLDEGRAHARQYLGESIVSWWGSSTVPAGGSRQLTGRLPMDSSIGIGFLIRGRDAEGDELTFHYYLELSQEIAE